MTLILIKTALRVLILSVAAPVWTACSILSIFHHS